MSSPESGKFSRDAGGGSIESDFLGENKFWKSLSPEEKENLLDELQQVTTDTIEKVELAMDKGIDSFLREVVQGRQNSEKVDTVSEVAQFNVYDGYFSLIKNLGNKGRLFHTDRPGLIQKQSFVTEEAFDEFMEEVKAINLGAELSELSDYVKIQAARRHLGD